MQQPDPVVVALRRWTELFMQRSARDFTEYARGSGISMPQLAALFHVHHRRGRSVTDLGDKLGVTSSAASQLLDRLVQQGLILRSEDPSDRRFKQLSLTEKGAGVLQESIHARANWLVQLAGTLSDLERQTVVAALNILIDKASHLGRPVESHGRVL